ncbi:hypothetical protein MUK42_11563 [Musa troglodytarum]|uniref:Uncharacterized protein n=1 Tax=Musa troglodytarum TaxID=320322 RepID=A0A9E7GLU4_9LILI|nr:hypothetical protein MUK42_11563 [Musa troglodytarum]
MTIAAAAACRPSPSPALRYHRVYCANRVKFASYPTSPTSFLLARHSLPLYGATVAEAGTSPWRTGASFSGEDFSRSPSRDVRNHLILDQILLVIEVLCIAPSVIFSIGCLVGSVLPGASKQFQIYLSNKVFVHQYFLLVGAVAIGSLIRWRQICMLNEIGTGADLIRRIEKMEEELRSSATIIRVLSKQLEKLGIRFRVTRKALKEPIAETAALAQKNSEATRALAMQEDILEKELGEIQKVLLAMQEQQQKQLELILAIGKAGRLLDSKKDFLLEQDRAATNSLVPERKEAKELEFESEKHVGDTQMAA